MLWQLNSGQQEDVQQRGGHHASVDQACSTSVAAIPVGGTLFGWNIVDFSRFTAWFTGIEKRALGLGDYTIAGVEDVCVIERKDLGDLVHSFTVERSVFIDRIRRMSSYPHRLLVITAPLSPVKSPYPHSGVNPNRVLQSSSPFSQDCACRLSVQKPMNLARKSWLRIYIRRTFINGRKPTIMAATSETMSSRWAETGHRNFLTLHSTKCGTPA